jgi:predicted nuclease with TOPRIM domain
MDDVSILVSGIDFKLQTLGAAFTRLTAENEALRARTQEQEIIINEQQKKITELQEHLNTLNIAKTLASRSEISDAKNRIGDLVREIDRCINLLNK